VLLPDACWPLMRSNVQNGAEWNGDLLSLPVA